jgi:succinyl-CoA synthetase beta subunit
MKIHEYQAKQLFREAGVAVPNHIVAGKPEEASAAFKQLSGPLAVVKAQIHAGGRGKGTIKEFPEQHGVHLVRSHHDAEAVARRMLGNKLVTLQTGPAGQTVRRVLVEAGCDIAREIYLGIVIDRASAMPVLMASSAGGMNIEEVAAKTPELIFKEAFHPDAGLQPYQVRKLCALLDITGPTVRSADKFMRSLCRLFVDLDCSLAEINPLVITKSGEVVALDGKISFDDNALFRHPQLAELRDVGEENPNELRAGKAGLSYVQLDGNIGCLVNGAGLAMATMDLVKLHGGEPANFLDVGGGANAEQVTEAFRILLSDKNVKAVLVNIFGGIMRCTTIATAIVEAYKQVGFNVPLVVRLEGTEVEQGQKILAESGVDIITAKDLTDAANKVVAAVKKGAA